MAAQKRSSFCNVQHTTIRWPLASLIEMFYFTQQHLNTAVIETLFSSNYFGRSYCVSQLKHV